MTLIDSHIFHTFAITLGTILFITIIFGLSGMPQKWIKNIDLNYNFAKGYNQYFK